MIARLTTLLAVLLVVPPSVARAQSRGTLRGQVLDLVSGQGVAGAIVELRRADSVVVTAMTNRTGHWLLAVTGRGEALLTIRAIGYAKYGPARLVLPLDGQEQGPVIRLVPMAVPLVTVGTTAKRGCGMDAMTADRLGAVLGASQVALETMTAAIRGGFFSFEVERNRRVTPDSRTWPNPVFASDTTFLLPVKGWPVRVAAPERLEYAGFVSTVGGAVGRVFYGPDATTLFSSWFIDRHCFILKDDPERAIFEIQFEPRTAGALIDLAGSFQVDRTTLGLTGISWEYRNLPTRIGSSDAGGSMEFTRLGSGLWYPARWSIWAPIEDRNSAFGYPTGPILAAVRETSVVRRVIDERGQPAIH